MNDKYGQTAAYQAYINVLVFERYMADSLHPGFSDCALGMSFHYQWCVYGYNQQV